MRQNKGKTKLIKLIEMENLLQKFQEINDFSKKSVETINRLMSWESTNFVSAFPIRIIDARPLIPGYCLFCILVVIQVSFLLPTEVIFFFGLPKCKNFFEAIIYYSKGSADIQLFH